MSSILRSCGTYTLKRQNDVPGLEISMMVSNPNFATIELGNFSHTLPTRFFFYTIRKCDFSGW